jgi:hypothetical protein
MSSMREPELIGNRGFNLTDPSRYFSRLRDPIISSFGNSRNSNFPSLCPNLNLIDSVASLLCSSAIIRS